MQGSISLTNQKQSVVSGREFSICCAHGLCSLAYCFSHCALDFPPTHPIVFPPCLRWHTACVGTLPAVAPAACRVFVFRLLTCARWLLAGLPPAACRPTSGCLPAYLRLLAGPLGCLPSPPSGGLLDLGLLIPPRPAACRVFGCLPMCVSGISIFNFVICSSACTFVCPLTISPYV